MWRSARLIGIFALIVSCGEEVPIHSELISAASRSELRESFGEPDRIRTGKYQPDVTGSNEPPVIYTDFEYWEYISTKDGDLGRTYFTFYINADETEELLGDWNWISVDDPRSVIQ